MTQPAALLLFFPIIAFDIWAWDSLQKDSHNFTYVLGCLLSGPVTIIGGLLILSIAGGG